MVFAAYQDWLSVGGQGMISRVGNQNTRRQKFARGAVSWGWPPSIVRSLSGIMVGMPFLDLLKLCDHVTYFDP